MMDSYTLARLERLDRQMADLTQRVFRLETPPAERSLSISLLEPATAGPLPEPELAEAAATVVDETPPTVDEAARVPVLDEVPPLEPAASRGTGKRCWAATC